MMRVTLHWSSYSQACGWTRDSHNAAWPVLAHGINLTTVFWQHEWNLSKLYRIGSSPSLEYIFIFDHDSLLLYHLLMDGQENRLELSSCLTYWMLRIQGIYNMLTCCTEGAGALSIQKCPHKRNIIGMWNNSPHPYTALLHKLFLHREKKKSQDGSSWGAVCRSVIQLLLGSYFGPTSEAGAVIFP